MSIIRMNELEKVSEENDVVKRKLCEGISKVGKMRWLWNRKDKVKWTTGACCEFPGEL